MSRFFADKLAIDRPHAADQAQRIIDGAPATVLAKIEGRNPVFR
jgi:hypothetical protein